MIIGVVVALAIYIFKVSGRKSEPPPPPPEAWPNKRYTTENVWVVHSHCPGQYTTYRHKIALVDTQNGGVVDIVGNVV
jgi:hypothetical protein